LDQAPALMRWKASVARPIEASAPMETHEITPEQLLRANTSKWREEQIRKRAHELYLARKGGPGSDVQDWLRAEAEIMWKLDH